MTVAVRLPSRKKASCRRPSIFSPGTTAMRACCPGAQGPANARTPTVSGCRRSCCSRRRSRPSRLITSRFLSRWPTIEALAAADLDDVLRAWAGLGYYARARNLHGCAKVVVERHAGKFPEDVEALRALPGIGDYTAAAIAAIAFDASGGAGRRQCRARGVAAVRGRGGLARGQADDQAARGIVAACRTFRRLRTSIDGSRRDHLLAQASGLRSLSVEWCMCGECERGDQETFPRKAPKREGKLRRGAAFVVLRDDATRALAPASGKRPARRHDRSARQRMDARFRFRPRDAVSRHLSARRSGVARLPGVVRHVFTHFPLELAVFAARVPRAATAPKGARWVKVADRRR